MKKTPSFYSVILVLTLLFAFCAESCSLSSDGSYSAPQTDYLVMMYLDGDNNLNDCSIYNLYYAQEGLMRANGSASVTVLALFDGNTSAEGGEYGDGKTHLYKLGAYTTSECKNGQIIASATSEYTRAVSWVYQNGKQEVNMASGNTLYNFLNWAKNNFNANHTILILQNHGGGPYSELESSITQSSRAICYDDTNGGSSYLSTTDEATAIASTFGTIDLLVHDACLMCSIEEIYGLQNTVHYLVSSPNTTYTNTLCYEKIIPYISTGASVENIGKRFIDYNKELILANESDIGTLRGTKTAANDPTCMELSLTLVDCSKTSVLANIKTHTSALATAILADSNKSAYCDYIGKLGYDGSTFYGLSFVATYVYTQDLGVMAYLLANRVSSASSGVKAAAANLYSDLKNGGLIVYGWAGGSEHQWYYSGNSSYGEAFGGVSLAVTDGALPWGISITSEREHSAVSLDSYSSWSEFANGSKWAELLSSWKN